MVEAVARAIDAALADFELGALELEARLRPPAGSILTQKQIDTLTAILDASPEWTKTHRTTVEHLWRLPSGDMARYVEAHGEAPVVEKKRKLSTQDIELPGGGWTARLALAVEETGPAQGPPPAAGSCFVRRKVRTSYTHPKRFRIDITQVMAADLDAEECTLELEIELQNHQILLAETSGHTLACLVGVARDITAIMA